MSDVVRVRIGGVEKNMNRTLALASDNVLILDGEPTRRLDGRIRSDEPVLRTGEEGGNSKADLEAEVARRNSSRDVDDQLDVKKGTVKDLEAALAGDDKSRKKVSDELRAAYAAEQQSVEAAAEQAAAGGSTTESGAAGSNQEASQ